MSDRSSRPAPPQAPITRRRTSGSRRLPPEKRSLELAISLSRAICSFMFATVGPSRRKSHPPESPA
jgi:hypothetical protein